MYSNVRICGFEQAKSILVTSPDKPLIGNDVRTKWQKVIDVIADCFDVPAGLIMQLDENKIRVFLSSQTAGNPYSVNDSESLMHGLYCETVVGLDKCLLVPDAREDTLWCNNPDIKLGMVSYLGFPIKWPDSEIFGTICVLDRKKNEYSEKFIDLMQILRDTIEEDLTQLLKNYNELKAAYDRLTDNLYDLEKTKNQLERSLQEKDILLSEIHHRVKNNLQIISSFVDLQYVSPEKTSVDKQLSSIKNRIQAMGLVHEILYKSKNFENISFKEYINLLTRNLKKVYGGTGTGHVVKAVVDRNLVFNLDTAIPVGLILNEIVTNSFKHAFRKDEKGKITIIIHGNSSKDFTMHISDNGCGISKDKLNKSHGLGLEIVNALVRQLNGTLKMDSGKGTSYFFTLNKVTKEEKRWLKKS